MEKKEFKVGEVFQCGLIKLKVIKAQNPRYHCRECIISKLVEDCDCVCFEPIVGECTCYDREDKNDVIFVKVEE